MSVVWQKSVAERRYEVRRAGNSLRLYTNNIFHSQYNAAYPFAGSVWDLLALPALFYPPKTIERILVLGVGGGAVIRTLNALVRPTAIVGIELDPVHLQIARRFFGLKQQKNVSLVEANAITWLWRYRGRGFDMVIDDLFSESPEGGARSVVADQRWCQRLLKVINPGGVLVQNFETAAGFRKNALLNTELKRDITTAYRLWVPGCDNRVGAFFKTPVAVNDLKSGLGRIAEEQGNSAVVRLRAKYQRLF